MIKELVYKNRSYRRFYADHKISKDFLLDLVDLGRMSSSAGNAQPLRYIISWDGAKNYIIFKSLSWASYYKDWKGPDEDERPSAYIVMLCSKHSGPNTYIDCGIAAENIMLGVTGAGLAGCMLRSFNLDTLRESLGIPPDYEVLLVLAIGKPKETVVVEHEENKDIKYWRDGKGVHHVNKLTLDEVLLEL